MALLALIKPKGANGFGYGTTAREVTGGLDLSGAVHVVTGVNSGLGLETVRALALQGAFIIGTARTKEKAAAALKEAGAEGVGLECELSEPSSILACTKAIQALGRPIDGITANAAIMALPQREEKHGVELQFLTNHIGHFTLVTGLLDQLSQRARVVVVSSNAHRKAPASGIELDRLSGEGWYHPWTAYGHSKLANILFTRELARRFEGSGRTANTLHPGVIKTALTRHMNPFVGLAMATAGKLVLKTREQGAATQVYLATHPEASNDNGAYFADCNPAPTSHPAAQSDELAQKLWEKSEEIVGGFQ